MHLITKISKHKKRNDRYHLYIDDAYAFTIGEDILIKYHLRKGLTLSTLEVAELQKENESNRAYLLAVNYLSYRMRTEREVRQYLRENDIQQSDIDQIINRLYEEKLLNDLQFAKAFVRDRINHSIKGPTVIMNELIGKGVAKKLALQALEQFSNEQQVENALKFANKEVRRKSNHSFTKQKERLKIKLIQKGYHQAVTDIVFEEIDFEKDENQESEVFRKHADKLYRKYARKYEGYELVMRLKSALYGRGFEVDLINEYVDNLPE